MRAAELVATQTCLANFIRMNGQLSEHPVGELIREISTKTLSGRLQLQRDRIVAVVYFEDGVFLYAAANVRTFRLREYLLRQNLVSEEKLEQVGDRKSDLALAAQLIEDSLVDERTIQALEMTQQADILRLVLLWPDGMWEFDARSHLNETVPVRLNLEHLLLDAARRMPDELIASRFLNEHELFSLGKNAAKANNLQPREGFILSRLDGPTPLRELLLVTGLPTLEAQRSIYALALAGYVKREYWRNVFREDPAKTSQRESLERAEEDIEKADVVDEAELVSFLERVERASTYYEVLGIDDDAATIDVKNVYYSLARRYHPDRFRRNRELPLHNRIESVFARITQAYETLGDSNRRATYDSKLEARRRAGK